MGQVLSQPVASQLIQRDGNKWCKVGCSEMQGFRINMEDTHTILLEGSLERHKDISYFGMYDGHAGEKCSRYLASDQHLCIDSVDDPTDTGQLTEAILKCDAEFLKRVDEREDGSTSCCAILKAVYPEGQSIPSEWKLVVANVGDSRAILIHPDGSFKALTEDHKPELPRERARIERAGGTVGANRVDSQLAMSRAMGDWSYKSDSTRLPEEQKVVATPDCAVETVHAGDMLLLCCDGIVEQLSNEQVVSFIHRKMNGIPTELEQEAKVDRPALGNVRGADGEVDPGLVMKELFRYSLNAGSKDNHSSMLILLGQDGTQYKRPDEFIAGPFHPYSDDKTFTKAYLTNAEKHGYSGPTLMAMASATEEELGPELLNSHSNDDQSISLQQLLASAFGGGGDPQSMQDHLMALSSMFAPPPGQDDDDDDDEEELPNAEDGDSAMVTDD